MPTEDESARTITLTTGLATFAAANPGYQLSARAVQSLSVSPRPWVSGCVTDLWYDTDGQVLYAVAIDGTYYYGTSVTNLDKFREPFERAASFGMRVGFGILADGTMRMLHLYPCKCPCD